MSAPITVAILGSGLFSRETIAPAIRIDSDFDVKAVWSRTRSSAAALAGDFTRPIDIYGGDQLDEVLARRDIEAVVIVLPIDIMV